MTLQQNNRRYEKVIASHYPGGAHLTVDVISTLYPYEQVIYTVVLTPLAASEYTLQDGRFVDYSDERQEYEVRCSLAPHSSGAEVMDHFKNRLEWIEENVKNAWSFDLHMASVMEAHLSWTFENLDDALLFKLSNF